MILFDTLLEDIFRLPPKRKAGLRHLQLLTARDLLYHFPHRYEKPAVVRTIAETNEGDIVTIEGKILSIEAKKTWKTKKPVAEAKIEEATPSTKLFPAALPPIAPSYGASLKGGAQQNFPLKIRGARGVITAIWFHQPYVARQLPPGALVRLTGKVTKYKNKLTMINPVHERISSFVIASDRRERDNPGEHNGIASSATPLRNDINHRIPIYSETYGISSLWIHAAIENIFSRLSQNTFEDPLPEDIRRRYHLPSLRRALQAIHFSQNEKEAEGARKRFAFEEIFFIQLSRVAMRNERNQQRAMAISIDTNVMQAFRESLPFTLTRAQEKAIGEICGDLSREVPRPLGFACVPMSRLLQGDVGSGKTLVAAAAALQVAKNPATAGQTAYMAPTEILARQHFAEFCKQLGPFGARIGLLTSSEALIFPSKAFPNKPAHLSKQQLFKKTQEGLVDIVIGTHALIAKHKINAIEPRKILTRFNRGISFKNLAFVIVDEQHRFGIHQRAALIKEGVHYLSMTATPIPRTLALTIYGDLDLSLLDEMPPGRIGVKTKVLKSSEREQAYELIAKEIALGRQAFVICPRIEKDEESEMKAVEEERERLQHQIFPHHAIGILHGRLMPKEKEKTMRAFRAGDFSILVATTVVEVGIDIPNATIMLIEGAERFGLAQLHQLRGRIGRSEYPSVCLAIPGASSKFARARLTAFANIGDGFALAEQDLQLRGPGELSGANQWGISDVGMEALRNIKMVEAARNEVQRILAEDPHLNRYPLLKKAPSFNKATQMHLE